MSYVILSLAALAIAAIPFRRALIEGRRLAQRNVRLLEGAQHRPPTATEVNQYLALREAWKLAQHGPADDNWRRLKQELSAWRKRPNFRAIALLADAPSGRHTATPASC